MLNTYTGIRSVSLTQLAAGRNLGLSGAGLVRFVMVPAASPYIFTGFELAWAYACAPSSQPRWSSGPGVVREAWDG